MITADDASRLPDPLARSTTRVLVVGAGPIGIETAIELRRRGIDTLNLDQGPLGAQVVAFPPRTRWFTGPERISIAGVPLVTIDQEKATREDYLAYLRSVVTQFEVPVRTYESVTSITPTGDGFEARTRTLGGLERIVEAERIVLAVGGTARPRACMPQTLKGARGLPPPQPAVRGAPWPVGRGLHPHTHFWRALDEVTVDRVVSGGDA